MAEKKNEVRTRFAPSPTGFMHIGNLRTALYAFLYTKKNKGKFILRIEDTDQARKVDGAIDMIYRTLKQAGMNWDEGPDVGGKYGPYIQSERMNLYSEYAHKLVELGKAYFCFCTKERLEQVKTENGDFNYDRHCRHLSEEEIQKNLKDGVPYVIRQKVPKGIKCTYTDLVFGEISVDSDEIEDAILLKSDGMPTYNFANVIDDHLMNITHVTRGVEYLSSTPKYNLIYDSFGWVRPTYIHLQPIMKDQTHKLSKRSGDANFEDFISKGYLPEAILNYIALLGWAPKSNKEKMTLQEMLEEFDISGISHSHSIFDELKMKWLNSEYLKELSDEEFIKVSKPFMDKCDIPSYCDKKYLASLLKTRISIMSEIEEKAEFINQYRVPELVEYEHKKLKVDSETAKLGLKCCVEVLDMIKSNSEEDIREPFVLVAEKNGIKSGQIMYIMRLALTGCPVTPGGAVEMIKLFGLKESKERIRKAYEKAVK